MPYTKIVYAGRHIMRGEGRMPSWNVQRTRERLVDWDLDESYIVPDTREHMRHPKSISITVGGLSAQGVCSLRTSSVKTVTCTFGSCATASPAALARSRRLPLRGSALWQKQVVFWGTVAVVIYFMFNELNKLAS